MLYLHSSRHLLRHGCQQQTWALLRHSPASLVRPKQASLHATHGAQEAHTAAAEAPKAAIMVIGDEILSGSVTDANTPWLAKQLYSRGVDLVRVEFIPDNKEDIIATVKALRQRVGPNGYVFSSGGIGPTHDDVTYEALASAFGVQLQVHEETVQRMQESLTKRGLSMNEARLRMATLPSPSEVLFTPGLWVPLVNLQGVYILPGIPKLFQSMITAHLERFTGLAFSSRSLYTHLGEGDLADPLAKIAAEHPKVSIGSYPNTTDPDFKRFKVKLQVTSRDAAAVEAAAEAIKATIGGMNESI